MTGDRVRIRIGEHSIQARRIGPLAENQDVRLLIRPAATSLTPAANAGHEGLTQDALPATVTDVAYRGRGYDHVVHCAAGTVTAVHALTAYLSGTQVQLHLDPDHCLAYPQEPTKTLLVEDAAPAIPEPRRTASPSFASGHASERRQVHRF